MYIYINLLPESCCKLNEKGFWNDFLSLLWLCEMCSMTLSCCLSLLCLQWGRLVEGSLWEAAALQSPQVQLFPLCPGALRQTRAARGGGEDGICRLRGAWKGVWVTFFSTHTQIKIKINCKSGWQKKEKSPIRWYTAFWAATRCWSWSSDPVLHKNRAYRTADGYMFTEALYPQWADDVGLKRNI